MPEPMMTPTLSPSSRAMSIPESATACFAATNPKCVYRSLRRASFGSMSWFTSQLRTSAPIWHAKADGSKSVTRSTPIFPAMSPDQNEATSWPIEVTTPRPVTTTRRCDVPCFMDQFGDPRHAARPRWGPGRLLAVNRGSGLASFAFDVIGDLAHRLKLLGVGLRNLSLYLVLELLLEGHDQLDRVQRIGTQIVKKGGVRRDLLLVDIELVHNDFLNALVYGFLVSHWVVIRVNAGFTLPCRRQR